LQVHKVITLELIICERPVSQQTDNRVKLREWKDKIAMEAIALYSDPVDDESKFIVEVTHYYKGTSPDVDNFHKPIQDALQGIVYKNDNQVYDGNPVKHQITTLYFK